MNEIAKGILQANFVSVLAGVGMILSLWLIGDLIFSIVVTGNELIEKINEQREEEYEQEDKEEKS